MSEKYEPVRASEIHIGTEGEVRLTKKLTIADLVRKIEKIENLEDQVSSLEEAISDMQLQIHDLAVKS